MAGMANLMDGLRNLAVGLGTIRDKGAQSSYYFTALSREQQLSAYRSSAIAARIVDIVAEDATREWREWSGSPEQISAIEAEEKRLNLQGKILEESKLARLSGGAGLYIKTRGNVNPSEPLDPATIGKGGIEYVTVLTRDELSVGQYSQDISDPNFGMPMYYDLNTAQGGGIRIHPSRIVPLHGKPLPRTAYVEDWSDSVLDATLESVKRVDATAGSTLALVLEAKIDVIRIPDFTENLRSGGSVYEDLVRKRFMLANSIKGINGFTLLDKEEEWDQKTANFSNLPEIMDRMMQLTSAASGIPMTLLFGTSPGGMNATGESDIRNYYDRVKVHQTTVLEPAMSVLDEALIVSALGSRPKEVFYNWRSLWQMDAKTKADVGKAIAETFKTLAETSDLPPEALSKGVVNALTEVGAAPGLEAAVEEFTTVGERRAEEIEE